MALLLVIIRKSKRHLRRTGQRVDAKQRTDALQCLEKSCNLLLFSESADDCFGNHLDERFDGKGIANVAIDGFIGQFSFFHLIKHPKNEAGFSQSSGRDKRRIPPICNIADDFLRFFLSVAEIVFIDILPYHKRVV